MAHFIKKMLGEKENEYAIKKTLNFRVLVLKGNGIANLSNDNEKICFHLIGFQKQ